MTAVDTGDREPRKLFRYRRTPDGFSQLAIARAFRGSENSRIAAICRVYCIDSPIKSRNLRNLEQVF